MSISGLNQVGTNSNLYAPKNNVLGKDDFLHLLVTQLKHQDPLSPMESADFSAQLAQFSSLEQLSNVNKNLEDLKLYQTSMNNSQAVDFIGKSIKAPGNSVRLTDDVPAEIRFELTADASEVSIHIYDLKGNFIKTFEAGVLAPGEHTVEWDGTNGAGIEVPEGIYKFEVLATDTAGGEVKTTSFIVEKVTGISFIDGVTYLLAGDQMIPIGNVIEITED